MNDRWLRTTLLLALGFACVNASSIRADVPQSETPPAEGPVGQDTGSPATPEQPYGAGMPIPGYVPAFVPVFPPGMPHVEVPPSQVPISYSPALLRTKTGRPLLNPQTQPSAIPMGMTTGMMPMPIMGAMYPGMPPVYPAPGVMPVGAMIPAVAPAPFPVMPAAAQEDPDDSAERNSHSCDQCDGRGCHRCGLLAGLSRCGIRCGGRWRGRGLGRLSRLNNWGLGIGLGAGDATCCAPRWFDIHAEAMFLGRDLSRRVDFTSLGLLQPPNIVLSSDDLSFDKEEEGFRVTAAMQLGAGTSLEVSYYGTFNWADTAFACDPDGNLFSALSDFGTDPPLVGFDDSDRSFLQQLDYSSSFDNLELDWRSRWVGPNCQFQGSWLMGVRYFYLDEDFLYLTRGDNQNSSTALPDKQERIELAAALGELRFMDYSIATINSLTGFQVGADLWTCIVPGLSIGAEGKLGLYGNSAKQTTRIIGNSIADFTEEKTAAEAAYVMEGDLMLVYRLTYSWTVRAGYHLLFVDGVALAPENFNSVPPEVFNPPPGNNRITSINANGNVFYHGGTIGVEWMW